MSYFYKAIIPVLKHEGGYVDDPHDRGGETNFGITKKVYPQLDIKNITKEDAIEIYRRDYWLSVYDQFDSYPIAAKVFDMAVNMGQYQAHKLLQRAAGVDDDGQVGPKTVEAVNAADSSQLLKKIVCEQLGFYEKLVQKRPSNKVFYAGWCRRAGWVPEEATA